MNNLHLIKPNISTLNNRFVSLKVGSGDAFFLKREEATILFDGGRSESLFAKLFTSELNLTHVDIIACSHNDSDHTNGIVGYLKSKNTCCEVWLPANWSVKIDLLLLEPVQFFEELFENIKDEINIQYLEDNISSQDFEKKEKLDFKDVVSKYNKKYLNSTVPENHLLNLSKEKQKLYSSLFNSAIRIREIAILAYQKHLKLRWFQYHSNKSSGGESYFKPINSIELNQIYSKKMSALEYLTLTRSNKESLVFYSPKINNLVDGVLFSADSDYSFSQNIPSNLGNNPIITVPHHGSKSNEKAYTTKQLSNYIHNKNTTLVRSDGNYKSRPGPLYKSFKVKKFCTRCNGFKTGQSIVLIPKNKSWTSSAHRCNC